MTALCGIFGSKSLEASSSMDLPYDFSHLLLDRAYCCLSRQRTRNAFFIIRVWVGGPPRDYNSLIHTRWCRVHLPDLASGSRARTHFAMRTRTRSSNDRAPALAPGHVEHHPRRHCHWGTLFSAAESISSEARVRIPSFVFWNAHILPAPSTTVTVRVASWGSIRFTPVSESASESEPPPPWSSESESESASDRRSEDLGRRCASSTCSWHSWMLSSLSCAGNNPPVFNTCLFANGKKACVHSLSVLVCKSLSTSY